MKFKKTFLLLTAICAIACVISATEAQLIKKIIKTKGGGGTDISELISKIPDEAQIVLSVNWENLAKTDLIDFGVQAIIGEDIKAIEEMGIDLKKDIKHFVLGITFEDEPEFYGVIAGTFDSKKIIEQIKASGVEIEETKIGDKAIYSIEDVFITFIDKGILFAGSSAGDDTVMKKMLETGEKNLANNPEMANLIKDTDTSATAWGAAIIPEEMRNELAEDESAPFNPKTLRTTNFSLNYAEMVTAKATVNFSEVGEAGKLVKFLTDQIASMNQEEGIPAEVQELIKNVKITADEKIATAAFEIEAKKLQDMLKSMMGAGIPGPDDESVEPAVEEKEGDEEEIKESEEKEEKEEVEPPAEEKGEEGKDADTEEDKTESDPE